MQAMFSLSLGDSAARLAVAVPSQNPAPATAVVFNISRRWIGRFCMINS
jgi:hypothetical protein